MLTENGIQALATPFASAEELRAARTAEATALRKLERKIGQARQRLDESQSRLREMLTDGKSQPHCITRLTCLTCSTASLKHCITASLHHCLATFLGYLPKLLTSLLLR